MHTAADVADAVERARAAAAWWAELGAAGRRARLDAWRVQLVRRTDELAGLIAQENGKPFDDAVVEVDHRHRAPGLGGPQRRQGAARRRVNPGLLAVNHVGQPWSTCRYGVVGVIGPWNYPVHTPMGSISYALAAGNAVVFKPSEYTPAVGRWLVDSFAERGARAAGVRSWSPASARPARRCAAAGVDKLAFTGSAATGRKVMAGCAATLTPCVIECGGKDALIVAADADLPRAAEQAVWGSMFNAGQTCAGVERVYVEAPVYQEFLERVADGGRRRCAPGSAARPHYGADDHAGPARGDPRQPRRGAGRRPGGGRRRGLGARPPVGRRLALPSPPDQAVGYRECSARRG